MQCGRNDEHKDCLKIDYEHIPAKVNIYQNGVLVNKWSEKKPTELVEKIIDGMDISGFGKINMKKALRQVLDVFEPKTIKIIEKEIDE